MSNIILLVEDNPDDVILTQRAFKKSNILNDLIIAKDGVEALDYLLGRDKYEGRDLSILPQVILLDLKMPRMDGLECLKRIRSNEDRRIRQIPVVVLTTSKEERDIIESYNLGANSYICKPVDFDQFHKAILNLGLYWIILNVNPSNIHDGN